MRKKEILVFTIFGFLNALMRLIQGINYNNFTSLGMEIDRVQKSNKPLADQLYGQMKALGHYSSIATNIFRALCILFLLYIGWYIAYGLLNQKYIVVGTLCVLVLPTLVQFAFQAKDWSIWIQLAFLLLRAAGWIIVMNLYRFAWKKTKLTKYKED